MLDTEPQLIDRYVRTGKVRLVYRHLIQLGERSQLLAEASECGMDQGSFWELRHAIYARYQQLYGDTLAEAEAAAAAAGADPTQIRACLDAQTYQAAVQADYAAAVADGIRSRPVFRIGTRTLIGAQRLSVFEDLLDRALAGS